MDALIDLGADLRSASVEDVRDAIEAITAGRSASTAKQYVLRVKSLLSYAHTSMHAIFKRRHRRRGTLAEDQDRDLACREPRSLGAVREASLTCQVIHSNEESSGTRFEERS